MFPGEMKDTFWDDDTHPSMASNDWYTKSPIDHLKARSPSVQAMARATEAANV
jgi:hypothetical protein